MKVQNRKSFVYKVIKELFLSFILFSFIFLYFFIFYRESGKFYGVWIISLGGFCIHLFLSIKRNKYQIIEVTKKDDIHVKLVFKKFNKIFIKNIYSDKIKIELVLTVKNTLNKQVVALSYISFVFDNSSIQFTEECDLVIEVYYNLINELQLDVSKKSIQSLRNVKKICNINSKILIEKLDNVSDQVIAK